MSSSDCIFCRIVAGEIPSEKILEDGDALAFLDVGPLAPGHCLLIPKTHTETLDAMAPQAVADVCQHLPAIVAAVREATGCDGVNILQNNGRIAGQVVPHVHFHIIPRSEEAGLEVPWPADSYPEGQMQQWAERIRKALGR